MDEGSSVLSSASLYWIKGQKNKGIELMVGGNPGLEQDQPAFAVCLPCALDHHVQLVSLLPSAITFLLGSQQ